MINPLLCQNYNEAVQQEAYDLFKTGDLEDGEYSHILIGCRSLQNQATKLFQTNMPPRKRTKSDAYVDRKF